MKKTFVFTDKEKDNLLSIEGCLYDLNEVQYGLVNPNEISSLCDEIVRYATALKASVEGGI